MKRWLHLPGSRLFARVCVLAALATSVLGSPRSAHALIVCFVDPGSAGPTHDGSTWAFAFTDLQTALGLCSGQIWVKGGVYKPGIAQTATFLIMPGQQVYGGFAGTETLLGQRDPSTNVTVLSGDIDSNDANHFTTNIDSSPADISGFNSYNVVTMDGSSGVPMDTGTVLDGFTITGGDGSSGPSDGGGMFCEGTTGVSGSECSPTLSNLTFTGNRAFDGGALFLHGANLGISNPPLTNVFFTGNGATDSGGAIYIDGYNGLSNPALTSVWFSSNTAATHGGAVFSYAEGGGVSNASYTNVNFGGNSAVNDGGAVYNDGSGGGINNPTFNYVTFFDNTAPGGGGAMFNEGSGGNSSPQLSNVTFNGNGVSAVPGGAMWNEASLTGASSPYMTNVTFSGNLASLGGAMYNYQSGTGVSQPFVTNVILWGDSGGEIYNNGAHPNISYSVVQGDCTLIPGDLCGAGNQTADPNLAPLGGYGGSSPTMALLAGSSAIDNGNSCPFNDQRGQPRPADGNNDGVALCDIGAYELQPNTIDVNVGGTLKGVYAGDWHVGEVHDYVGTNNGPAQVTNSTLNPLVSSIRVIFGGSSYSEMMGYPDNTTTDFWFPWYNDVAFDSQFRVSNLSSSSTTITVALGGGTIDSFTLGAGAAIRKNYPGQNSGPMHVSSSGQPILSTIRVLYGGSSYSEMMGFPNNSTTNFWFPWYNNTAMDSQFRVSNLGGSSTTITVSLAGSPIDSFTLGAGAAVRKNYAGQNNGPMQVSSSSQPILSTIRVLYAGTSYSEMMGFPNNSTTSFFFPWYDNVGTNAQFRVGNLGGSSTTINVYLAGTPIDSFSLGAGAAVRKNYAATRGGTFHVLSTGQPILATVRTLYGASSFYELMGYPNTALTPVQYFPWYNNTAFSSQVRFGVP